MHLQPEFAPSDQVKVLDDGQAVAVIGFTWSGLIVVMLIGDDDADEVHCVDPARLTRDL